MLKEIYEIDKDGFIKDNYLGKFDENGELMEIVGGFEVEKPVIESLPNPIPYRKPKWNGTEWVEGETSEEKAEREELFALEGLKPTQQELEESEFEIKILTLLSELEMV